MTAFISYSGDRIDRAELVFALREHGVTPWRDIENLDIGDNATATIESELGGCSGVILWINEQVLGSDYVATVELPAIAREARDRGIRIVPVFDGLSPGDAIARVSKLGIEVGENNGHLVDTSMPARETAGAIAARYARGHVREMQRAGRPPIVRLVTYDDTAAYRSEATLNLDWRHHFGAQELDASAQTRLRSALNASAAAVKEAYGAAEILIAVKAHLPVALALGHVFAEPTGCTLRMEREDVVYRTARTLDAARQLEERHYPRGPATARAAALEVAVARDTEAGVTAYVAAGNRYRDRVELLPAGGPNRFAMEPTVCNVWAGQVGNALARLTAQSGIDRVDLFLASPVEMAVAIGWWANAAGAVQVFNWTGKSGPYSPMWTLP